MKRLCLAAVLGCVSVPFMVAPAASAARALPACVALHWVGAWEAPPSDATQGYNLPVDDSANPKPTVNDSSVRATFTPTYGGSVVRVHLSNRFGTHPVTFTDATIARSATGPAIVGSTLRRLTFDGRDSVTVAAGHDVVSDPVKFAVRAFQTLAVSVYVPTDVGYPTEHFLARQYSYATPPQAGDATRRISGAPFSLRTTTRPFVTGLDVRAAASTGAVVTLGDSITDGAQNEPAGFPENPAGIGANVRYSDDLARRLRGAHIPLAVLNAGIGGNRLLHDGGYGGNFTWYGPSALHRLRPDVLRQAGATTVIMLLGINDAFQNPLATPAEIIAGDKKIIARMHAAGLRVLQGTLTPFEGYPGTLGVQAQEEAIRLAVNKWIRTKSPADAIVDFDAAVRDPSDPERLNPRYDDGDHLHFSDAGYKRLAQTVPLSELALAPCGPTFRRLTGI
jgi:lysophospholipase L1-like esterase